MQLPELFQIDTRLRNNNLAILSCLGFQKAEFILDDFDVIEKGDSNTFLLNQLLKKRIF